MAQEVLLTDIFDQQAIARFRARAMKLRAHGANFLLARVAEEMSDRLGLVERSFNNAAITSGNGAFIEDDFLAGTRHAAVKIQHFNENWQDASEERLGDKYSELDLALSFLSLHETNDTPGALVQIRQRLRPDGLFMGVMPGGDTLYELRECLIEAETRLSGGISPRVYPFADVRSVGALLQRAGFALPVVDSETITVRYQDMFALFRDLRQMGASNAMTARPRTIANRLLFLEAAKLYHEKFAEADGKIPATFTFIWMSGWAPDDTQQKPAKRGSATVSLAKVLREI